MTTFALWLVGLGGRSSTLALTLLNVIVLARSLGPLGRGQYFVFVSFILVMSAVADLGVSQSAVVFSGKGEVPMSTIHRVVLALALTLGAVVALATVLALPILGENVLAGIPQAWSLAALGLFPLAVYANFWTGMMIGARLIVEVNAVQLAMSAVTLAANVALVVTSGNATIAVSIYVAVLALQGLVMYAIAARAGGSDRRASNSGKVAREMLAFGTRAYTNALSGLVWARSGVFVLNALHGAASAGIYSVAQQIAEKALAPIQALQDVIYNRMSSLPTTLAVALLNRYLRLTIAAVVPTFALGIALAPVFLPELFSESFRGAILPLQILFAGSAVQSVPVILATYFVAHVRRPGFLSVFAVANTALHLALLFAFVPSLAETGAALAMVATQVTGTSLILSVYLRMARTDAASALLLRSGDLDLIRRQALGSRHH